MTTRERTALLLVGAGVVALIIAAAAFGGWRLAVAVAGGLMLGGGVLLGLGDDAPVVLVDHDDSELP